ncbi:MAG: hypothetical protein R3301_11070 [Saprospiraceae bacterium]|nr:hypothetical protein [Saprospiraceae bacterium]
MAQLLHEIAWGEPIFPVVPDPEWEHRVKSELGMVSDYLKRLSPIPWVREAALIFPRIRVTTIPQSMQRVGELVIAQENACRFCYGVAKSTLRLYGHSDKLIGKIERQMHLAELDDKERAFIRYCRDLARSRPRPPKVEVDRLRQLGYDDTQIADITFMVAGNCFMNRLATFTSCPPVKMIETMSGKWMRFMWPLLRRRMNKWAIRSIPLDEDDDSFPAVIKVLRGLPGGGALRRALQGAFASDVLSSELKVLMFAVVARTLECQFCQTETKAMAADLGIPAEAFDEALITLSSPRLDTDELQILEWTRETISYQNAEIQERVRALTQQIDPVKVLEAVGISALANTVVRIGVLLDS